MGYHRGRQGGSASHFFGDAEDIVGGDVQQGAENAAADYLVRNGYSIRHRNWRSGRKELDIVADNGEELIVVEVKSRKDTEYARPEDAVTATKIRRIVSATDKYINQYQLDMPVRFDIITVTGTKGHFSIEHIENAFYSPIW